eukprot:6255510-Alexandrium_andersonii.AAC.1
MPPQLSDHALVDGRAQRNRQISNASTENNNNIRGANSARGSVTASGPGQISQSKRFPSSQVATTRKGRWN